MLVAAASISGATEQPLAPIGTSIPRPVFGTVTTGPFSPAHVRRHLRPLGAGAPPWARWLYRRSIRVLVALTDPFSGATIAGDRAGWDYVWPRDAAAASIALHGAGLRAEGPIVAAHLARLGLHAAARFHPGGEPVPGRAAAGDAGGWVGRAERANGLQPTAPGPWRDRQDYGENVTGELLGNAIAAGVPAREILSRFLTSRGLVREQGRSTLDSSAAWAVTVFPRRQLLAAARTTLLRLARESGRYGIPPMEGWTPGEVWTAPTAWSAWALAALGHPPAARRP